MKLLLTKYTKKIAIVLAILLLMSSCFYMGSKFEYKTEMKREAEYQLVDTIAVVNLDVGIESNDQSGKSVFYSNDLLQLNSSEFETTSLEAARVGIGNGTYAAYVVVPTDFSQAVESVNISPQKATLAYQLNPNLEKSVREQTLRKIEQFQDTLGHDISYIYVSAILNDFHEVQDSSETIMKNDLFDLKTLQNVEPKNLISPFEYPELVEVDQEVEELKMKDLYESIQASEKGIKQQLETGTKKGKKAFGEVQLIGKTASDSVAKAIDEVDKYKPGYDKDGNVIYQSGLDTISANFAKYNAAVSSNSDDFYNCTRTEVNRFAKIAVGEYIINAQSDNNAQLGRLLDAYQDEANRQLNEYLVAINKHYKDKGISDADLYDTDTLSIDLTGALSGSDEITLPPIVENAYGSGYDSVSYTIKDEPFSSDFDKEIEQLCSVSMNGLTDIIDQQIIKVLSDQQNEVKVSLDTYNKEVEQYNKDYKDAIDKYDIFDYIDDKVMKQSVDKIGTDIADIEKRQLEHDKQYLDLFKAIYEMTNTNNEAINTNMKESQTGTKDNVETIIQELKTKRGETSEQNITLLREFTQKLQYTRLGSMENTRACEFVIAPVVFVNQSVESNVQKPLHQYDQYWMLCMAIGVVLLVIFAGLSIVLKRESVIAEEDYDNFS